ncbi:hypothetical protein NIES4071_14230 [Calothrix sp. NIES-4071]|nr:hypothetical protein NIES4071_14230 [Calothrix sp. NIES-4071]BAZ55761.1 hypothetical protein NIES4105_14180 [Calothrix sp. NIES-4105]
MKNKTARSILLQTAILYAQIKHLPREKVKFYIENIDTVDVESLTMIDKEPDFSRYL